MLFVAGLMGLGATAAGKAMGLFGTPAKEAPALPQVLVAAKTIFKDTLIETSFVTVRDVSEAELADYNSNRSQYLPPMADAVFQRIAAKNIEAGQVIKRSDLVDINRPDPLAERLLPQMRAVNVSVKKERSAGGLIQTGEWVDVTLTTSFSIPEGVPGNRTVLLARNVRVIAKRNSLWPVFRPLPEDQPIDFTLEANPYRAALIEFARDRGFLSLTPLPESRQKALEKARDESLKSGKITFSDPESKELKDEDERVAAFNRGDLTVGEPDLLRILSLSLPKPPVSLELITGQEREKHTFKGDKHDVTPLASSGSISFGKIKGTGLPGSDSESEAVTFSKPEGSSESSSGPKFGMTKPPRPSTPSSNNTKSAMIPSKKS
jgi:Flp pilus assembly protein CpaB